MLINLSIILLCTYGVIYPIKHMEKTTDLFLMVEISAATKVTITS